VKPFCCTVLLLLGLFGCCMLFSLCSMSDPLSVSLSVKVSWSFEWRECSLEWFVCWSVSLLWSDFCFMFCAVGVLVVVLAYSLVVVVVVVLLCSLSVYDGSISSSTSLSECASCISSSDDSDLSDSSPSYFVSGGVGFGEGYGGSSPVMCSLHWASVMLEWKGLLFILLPVVLWEFGSLGSDSFGGGVGGVVVVVE
jgi:hypothetical protein